MGLRICFCRATVNRLTETWQHAVRRGDRRVVQRATALLRLAEQCASLAYRPSPGRPAKLTPPQKQRLRALVAAGPEAAGYATGC